MKAKRDGDAFQRKSGDVVSGDWSDTYFHCACCASTMKKMMPHLRPIVVLRDPIGRTMARYVEENHPSLDAVGRRGSERVRVEGEWFHLESKRRKDEGVLVPVFEGDGRERPVDADARMFGFPLVFRMEHVRRLLGGVA